MQMDIDLAEPASVGDLWQHLVSSFRQLQSEDLKAIAGISINNHYIGRNQWESVYLTNGDHVLLVSQMAGG